MYVSLKSFVLNPLPVILSTFEVFNAPMAEVLLSIVEVLSSKIEVAEDELNQNKEDLQQEKKNSESLEYIVYTLKNSDFSVSGHDKRRWDLTDCQHKLCHSIMGISPSQFFDHID